MTTRELLARVAVLSLLAAAAPARATTVDLVAEAFDKAMPGGRMVRMWGFRAGTSDCTVAGGATVPGPVLSAAPGEPLTVNVRNCLPAPISIVIPALPAPIAPVTGADGRVTSFTATTAPGALGSYVFPAASLRPGTFLYHSGTQPQVQVQMGLYGALTIETAAGEAYPGIATDRDAVLVFSEVDPALHDAVAAGTFGTPAYPSTMRYAAQYFLVNGEAAPGIPDLGPVATNERVLLRLVNAGLEAHVPEVVGLYMRQVAEDAFPYPSPREEYSALLPAGKTVDALLVAAAPGRYAIYDRALSLSNPATGAGGMLTRVVVQAVEGAPQAFADAYAVAEDTSLDVLAPGVLGNDVASAPLTAAVVQPPAAGSLSLAADGSFTYAPAANFTGTDFFTYRATDGSLLSNVATVTIAVTPVNDAPHAMADSASVDQGFAVEIDVLANDMDVDGDALAVASFGQGTNGAVAASGTGLVYTPNAGFSGTDAFTYVAADPSGATSEATVTVTVIPHVNQPPVAADDYAATRLNTPVVITVVANDSDPDGAIDPSSVAIVTAPTRRGVAVNNLNGTVTFTPRRNFRGTDVFTYTVRDTEGAVSNVATVRVNVQ